ncbi:hypothetical protein BY996DRAFT_8683192 [Phakopsora pachyrhizi]|nr:hypothetical protein BY996DRAFT_8683192 [Phakopsora pachyrhizi]
MTQSDRYVGLISIEHLIESLQKTHLTLSKIKFTQTNPITKSLLSYPSGLLAVVLETLWVIQRVESLFGKVDRAIERQKGRFNPESQESIQLSERARRLNLQRRDGLVNLTCHWASLHFLGHLCLDAELSQTERKSFRNSEGILRHHFSLSSSDYHRTTDRPYISRLLTTNGVASRYAELGLSLISTWSDESGDQSFIKNRISGLDLAKSLSMADQVSRLAADLSLPPINPFDLSGALEKTANTLIRLTLDWVAGSPCETVAQTSYISQYLEQLLKSDDLIASEIDPNDKCVTTEVPQSHLNPTSKEPTAYSTIEPTSKPLPEKGSSLHQSVTLNELELNQGERSVDSTDRSTIFNNSCSNSQPNQDPHTQPTRQDSNTNDQVNTIDRLTESDQKNLNSENINCQLPRSNQRKRLYERYSEDEEDAAERKSRKLGSKTGRKSKRSERKSLIAENIINDIIRESPRLSVALREAEDMSERRLKELDENVIEYKRTKSSPEGG